MPRRRLTRQLISAERESVFWSLVKKGDEEECWLWLGHKTKYGYGMLSIGGRKHGMDGAHRISWVLANGDMPDGLVILHTCDNPTCVNPKHLRVGSYADNMEDAVNKGRLNTGDEHWARRMPERLSRGDRHHTRVRPETIRRGEKVGGAILTEDAVREIRSNHAAGTENATDLATRFGVHRDTIYAILKRRLWKHVL